MFCFYFGCICTITPPVALAAYTAAGISGASPSKTGWRSFIVGIAAFIVPFLFVYKPALLLQGTAIEIAWTTAITLMAIYSLAALTQRCISVHINLAEAALLVIVIFLAFYNSYIADVSAVALFVLVQLMQRRRKKRMIRT